MLVVVHVFWCGRGEGYVRMRFFYIRNAYYFVFPPQIVNGIDEVERVWGDGGSSALLFLSAIRCFRAYTTYSKFSAPWGGNRDAGFFSYGIQNIFFTSTVLLSFLSFLSSNTI